MGVYGPLLCSDEAPDCQMESNFHAFMGGLGTCMCKKFSFWLQSIQELTVCHYLDFFLQKMKTHLIAVSPGITDISGPRQFGPRRFGTRGDVSEVSYRQFRSWYRQFESWYRQFRSWYRQFGSWYRNNGVCTDSSGVSYRQFRSLYRQFRS